MLTIFLRELWTSPVEQLIIDTQKKDLFAQRIQSHSFKTEALIGIALAGAAQVGGLVTPAKVKGENWVHSIWCQTHQEWPLHSASETPLYARLFGWTLEKP